MTDHQTLTLRPATTADAGTLHRLAALDSQRDLTGDVFLAEVAGRAVAALSVADGRVVADPFERTAGAVALLRARAAAPTMHRARRAWRPALTGAG